MRRLNKNKGYSLVELMIALAIFSIVMVAIIFIMRTTIVSYRAGLFETEAQEEAQILVNQICDLLVDANSVTGSGGSYSIQGADATTSNLIHSGNKLKLNGEVLSDQVDSFSIELAEGGATNYDNTARVSVGMNYQGREYVVDKDVYFRNVAVETPDLFDLNQKEKIITGGTDDPYTKKLDILRYDSEDLTEKYGIIKLTEADTTVKTNYQIKVNGTLVTWDNISSIDLSGGGNGKNNSGIVVECNDTIKNGFTTPVDTCVLKGTDGTNTYTFQLSTDAVAFNQGSDLYLDHTAQVDSGWQTPLEVKGINIKKAVNSGLTVKYKVAIYRDGMNDSNKLVESGRLKVANNDKLETVSNWMNFDKGRISLGLISDPYSNDFMISTGSDALRYWNPYGWPSAGWDGTAKDLDTTDGNYRVKFDIYFNTVNGNNDAFDVQIDNPVTYKYYTIGTLLDNANKYSY